MCILSQNFPRKISVIINNIVDFRNLKLTESQNAPMGPDFGYSIEKDIFIKMEEISPILKFYGSTEIDTNIIPPQHYI